MHVVGQLSCLIVICDFTSYIFLCAENMMKAVHYCIKEQLPEYLKSLPLPKSFSGFAALTGAQWLQLLPFLIVIFIFLFIFLSPILSPLWKRKKSSQYSHVNEMIKKNEKKIVDIFNIEDIGDKKSFCRCWKSLTVYRPYSYSDPYGN